MRLPIRISVSVTSGSRGCSEIAPSDASATAMATIVRPSLFILRNPLVLRLSGLSVTAVHVRAAPCSRHPPEQRVRVFVVRRIDIDQAPSAARQIGPSCSKFAILQSDLDGSGPVHSAALAAPYPRRLDTSDATSRSAAAT